MLLRCLLVLKTLLALPSILDLWWSDLTQPYIQLTGLQTISEIHEVKHPNQLRVFVLQVTKRLIFT